MAEYRRGNSPPPAADATDSEAEGPSYSNKRPGRGQTAPENRALHDPRNAAGDVVNRTPGAGAGPGGHVVKRKGPSDKKDTVRLSLDLDLAVDIQLKATIYGNVELALITDG